MMMWYGIYYLLTARRLHVGFVNGNADEAHATWQVGAHPTLGTVLKIYRYGTF